ncbi:MAG TPA: hypothetical protein VFA54_02570 [Bryobacterales bacterium]|jgi:hypothetical protein|nr:hypothetical protein [Bryobacterales bacterium]
MFVLVLLLLALGPAAAQEILLYPEFQRPSPRGDIVPADRGGRQWEIISPAMPRNGHAGFFVAARLREPGFFRLDIAMNPVGRLRADLYRVWFGDPDASGERYPGRLTLVGQTVAGRFPDDEQSAPDPPEHQPAPASPASIPARPRADAAGIYWLDLYAPRDLPSGRIRLEVVLQSAGPRVVYPMEVRILPIAFPDRKGASDWKGAKAAGTQPDQTRAAQPAQTIALQFFSAWWNAQPLPLPASRNEPLTVESRIERDVLQDLELLESLAPKLGRDKLRADVSRLMAGDNLPPDRWLEVRRWIYRTAQGR